MLTKSLHTVTAVTNVARHLHATDATKDTGLFYLRRSLSVLGYDSNDLNDPTVMACFKSVRKMLEVK